jgi:hypothetical protein
MNEVVAVYTNDGFNWSLEIDGTLIKTGFSNPYEAYKFFNFCSHCWFKGVDNV